MNSRSRAIIIAVLLAALVFAGGCSWFHKNDKSLKKKGARATKPRLAKCPLCGLTPVDPIFIQRRPVAIKIENDPAARPQSGLGSACVIYEEECEGGITRFLAIFLDRDASAAGPVRSARPADLDITFPYDALFCHCGGSPPVLAMVKQSGIADLDQFAYPGAYWRSSDRRAPHNLYSTTARLREAGDTLCPYEENAISPFRFFADEEQAKMERDRADEIRRSAANAANPSPEYKPSMTVVQNIHIPYLSICAVDYAYDSTSGRFMRLVKGVPHIDRNTGSQLAADNVIVQYVTTTPSGLVDSRGADMSNLGIVGSGRAQVFVRGALIDANWRKLSRADHTAYTDNSGKVIRFKPGTTWIELVPTTKQVTFN
ncbi:MAG: hypothetical protein CVT63_00775 [Candidatus Anoxymicrobium japonicum]|uniref:DUF3048 domain-containing protein n=1 Tax=Candidatus Anoxymicrobium japonicum TaxID=2013648 RepID=A0A2N3G7Z1_9ACTN|nr:MAG: hypothetical protein CVT63_00775 [Candidatus Anoxymicrobium japonicum]